LIQPGTPECLFAAPAATGRCGLFFTQLEHAFNGSKQNLDIAQQLKLLDMIKQLAGSGKGVVLVLHDLSQALRIADTVVLMQEGRVVSGGTPEELYESGRLQEVFGVQIERFRTKNGWHYVYDAKT
jgi:ABC-type cobalamin/Fe3+-siderophores transport system ATPase subunit